MAPKNRAEYREAIAKAFLDCLNEKGLEWRKGWDGGSMAPQNAVTKRPYHGVNQFYLGLLAMSLGYTDSRWATMTQIIDKDGKYHPGEKWHLQKGSKAVYVEYWYAWNSAEKKALTWREYRQLSEDEQQGYVPKVRYTPVFHASMIDGIAPLQTVEQTPHELADVVTRLSGSMGVAVEFDGGDRAFYRPSEDKIHVPTADRFISDYELNATVLHELAHATGHESRLNRPMGGEFGSPEYAYEELVAEISSSFMGVTLDIEQTPQHLENHKAYVQGWIEAITKKPETLMEAIRDAQKAADYMDYHAGLVNEQVHQAVQESSITVPVPEEATPKQTAQQPELITIGNIECTMLDQWQDGNYTCILGRAIDGDTFYYAQLGGSPYGTHVFEYDSRPSRDQIISDYADWEAMRDLDRHEAGETPPNPTALSLDPTVQPIVTILLSESDALQAGEQMSLSHAEALFQTLDAEKAGGQGYDKIVFRIDYTFLGARDHYEGRYDLGDGDGSLIAHIKAYHESFQDNEDWKDHVVRNGGEEAWTQDQRLREMTITELVPYFEMHCSLSKMELAATQALESWKDLTPGQAAYFNAVLDHVNVCRGMLNNGDYSLPVAPQLSTFSNENKLNRMLPGIGIQSPQLLAHVEFIEDSIAQSKPESNPQISEDETSREAVQQSPGWSFAGGRVVANTERSRLQVIFDEKPADSIRAELKANGFHWASIARAWQRPLTSDAYRAVRQIAGIQPGAGSEQVEHSVQNENAVAQKGSGEEKVKTSSSRKGYSQDGEDRSWSPVTRSGKLHYTDDQYRVAREASALEYARRQGYHLVRDGGGRCHLDAHDSMVFLPDGTWHWNSRDLHGGAIEFMTYYEGKTLPEAVLTLNGIDYTAAQEQPQPRAATSSYAPSQEDLEAAATKREFVLPPRAEKMSRAFSYLCTTRGLDYDLVRQLVHDGRIYESENRRPDGTALHNVVFVGFDQQGVPRSASLRGCSQASKFKLEQPGSDKTHPFMIPGKQGSDTLYVFESAIDAASHATIQKLAGLDWQSGHRIGQGGNAPKEAILNVLEAYPEIQRICICTDTDDAGERIYEKISDRLIESGIPEDRIQRLVCPVRKDWNEYLQTWRETVKNYRDHPTTSFADQGVGEPCGRIHFLDSFGVVDHTVAYIDEDYFKYMASEQVRALRSCVVETPAQLAELQRNIERHAARQKAAQGARQAEETLDRIRADGEPDLDKEKSREHRGFRDNEPDEPAQRMSMEEQLAAASMEANQRNQERQAKAHQIGQERNDTTP